MPIMSIRNDYRWPMHAEELRETLGLGKRLPHNTVPLHLGQLQGYEIRLDPIGEQKTNRNGYTMRRMTHRLRAACKGCGCWIPCGRLKQHERACKQLRDNTSI